MESQIKIRIFKCRSCGFTAVGDDQKKRQEQIESGQNGRQVRVPGIECRSLFASDFSRNDTGLVQGQLLFDAAIRVNDGGDAGVGAAADCAVVFQGPETDIHQVLPRSRGVAEPGVVGQVDQNIGAGGKKAGSKGRKNPFKAD